MFKFHLQKVLDYRDCLQKKAELIFASELRILLEEEKILSQKKNEKIKYLEDLMNEESIDFDINYISFFLTYIYFLEREVLFRTQTVEKAKVAVEEAREELVKKTKEKEVLVKLKENMLNDYLYQELEKEQKFLDDISTIKFIRTKEKMDFINI